MVQPYLQCDIWSHLSSMETHCPSLQVNCPESQADTLTFTSLEEAEAVHRSPDTPEKSNVWTPSSIEDSGELLDKKEIKTMFC